MKGFAQFLLFATGLYVVAPCFGQIQNPIVERQVDVSRLDIESGSLIRKFLSKKNVQEELGLQKYQLQEISNACSKLQKETSKLRTEIVEELDDLGEEVAQKMIVDLYVERQVLIDKAILRIILPEQYKRLKQLFYWYVVDRSGSLTNVLNIKAVRVELEINKKQQEQIASTKKELQEKYFKELKSLNKKYHKMFLEKSLTPIQRTKFEAMLGEHESFDKTKPSF